jgi:hypothetical protein
MRGPMIQGVGWDGFVKGRCHEESEWGRERERERERERIIKGGDPSEY